MLSRIAAIFTVLCISSIFDFASAQKNDKICEYCRKMATTGSSPYEILWILRGGIGKEFVSDVLERKMFLRVTDIKQAEGIFLEYCRNLCIHTLEGRIWDEMGRSNYRKGKILHFQSLHDEEKYTKLGKKEFKKLKKKTEIVSGVKKTTEAKRKPTTERSFTKNNNYAKIYNNLMPNLNFLNRFSSSRSLHPPSADNSTVDSATLNDTLELSMRQIPDQSVTTPGSDSNTTDTSEDHTTETSFDMTDGDVTKEIIATTMPATSKSEESTESDEESQEDDTTEEEPDTSEEPKVTSPKPNKSHDKEDIENLIKYLLGLISDPESDMIFKQAISMTRNIVKCIIDITMTEIERALGIAQGSLVRERCETSKGQTSLESTILGLLKDILGQSNNLQDVIPLSGVKLPPPVPQPHPVLPQSVFPQPVLPRPVLPQPVLPQPVFPQSVFPHPVFPQPVLPQPGLPQPILPQPVFQPELPPNYEIQLNYPDLQAPTQYYDDYGGGIPQQGIFNLFPPSPMNSPPFLPQNNNFEEEPINYPDYSEAEPFIGFPEPPPQPFVPSLGSANSFENFIAWRRAMPNIRSYDDEQQP